MKERKEVGKRDGGKANRTEKGRGNEMVIQCECLRGGMQGNEGGAWEFEIEKEDGTKWQLQFLKSALGETERKRGELERRLARQKEKIKERQKKRKGKKDRTNKSIESVVHLFNWQFWVGRVAESPVSPNGPSQSSGRTDVPWSLSLRPLPHQDAWLGALSGAWVRVKKKGGRKKKRKEKQIL